MNLLNNDKGFTFIWSFLLVVVLTFILLLSLKTIISIDKEMQILEKTTLCYQNYWFKKELFMRVIEALNFSIRVAQVIKVYPPTYALAENLIKGMRYIQEGIKAFYILYSITNKKCSFFFRSQFLLDFPYELNGILFERDASETTMTKDKNNHRFIEKSTTRLLIFSGESSFSFFQFKLKLDSKLNIISTNKFKGIQWLKLY